MDTSYFYELVDYVGRDEDAYVRVDRLRIAKEFLESLCDDSEEIGNMTVTGIIALMEDAL